MRSNDLLFEYSARLFKILLQDLDSRCIKQVLLDSPKKVLLSKNTSVFVLIKTPLERNTLEGCSSSYPGCMNPLEETTSKAINSAIFRLFGSSTLFKFKCKIRIKYRPDCKGLSLIFDKGEETLELYLGKDSALTTWVVK